MLRRLERHEVEYVVIGGVAARLYGSPRLTEDLDVTPATTTENLHRLAAALRDLDAKLRVVGHDPVAFELDERAFGSFTTMTLSTRLGPLDLAFRPDATGGYPDLSRSAETVEVYGLTIRLASLDDIIRSKEAANRAKDREALRGLRELREVRARRADR